MKTIKMNQKGFSAIELMLVLVVVLLIGAVGFFVYDSQDAATTTDTPTNSTEKTTEPTNTPSTLDEQVLAALKAYCNANVDPTTKQPFVLTVGRSGKDQKEVLYSSDKIFASVNAVCSSDGTTGGSGSAYYFKKVNDTWVFLYNGQMESAKYKEQFNIPSDFN